MTWQGMEQEQQAGQFSQIEQKEQNQEELELSRYRQLFQKLVEEEEQLHAENLKRIKIGMQCLIWIPMIFMVLLFLTEGEKVIFLVLWIASLFMIASYLIYVEYIDFKAQERLHGYQDNGDDSNSNLIGGDIEAFEETVVELLRQIDEKKAANREKMLLMLGQHYERLSGIERKGARHD